MKSIADNKYNLFLLGFILLLFFLNAYNLTFNFKPTIVHQWRQSDCLSIAKNYYEEGMHFFQPKIHWQGTIGGRAVGELPVINYTVAALWKLFGQQEGTYRILNYLIYIIAIFVLFNTISLFNKNFLIRFFFISLLLSSPLLAYYSYNFLADVPALSFSILGLCLFLRFYYSGKKRFFYPAVALSVLAALLKASAIVPFLLILIFSFIDLSGLNKKFRAIKLFSNRVGPLIILLVAVGGLIGWYIFAAHYNKINNSGVFLIGILPIWEMGEKDILKNLTGFVSDQSPVFFNSPVMFLWFIGVLYVSFNVKLLDSFLKYSFIISFAFFILFIIFFFRVFDVHDYYLINLMIFPVVTFLCLSKILSLKELKLKGNKFLITAVTIIISFNSLYAAAFYRLRTIKDDKICYWYPFFNKDVKDSNSEGMWMYSKTMGILADVTPDLRKLGIKRDDLFISIPDVSPNSSLYLMDQKGYTMTGTEFSKDTLWKSRYHFSSCKYLVISDTVFKDSLSFKLISNELQQVYKKQRVEVYRIMKK